MKVFSAFNLLFNLARFHIFSKLFCWKCLKVPVLMFSFSSILIISVAVFFIWQSPYICHSIRLSTRPLKYFDLCSIVSAEQSISFLQSALWKLLWWGHDFSIKGKDKCWFDLFSLFIFWLLQKVRSSKLVGSLAFFLLVSLGHSIDHKHFCLRRVLCSYYFTPIELTRSLNWLSWFGVLNNSNCGFCVIAAEQH